ncbi:MAG: hypothetical protein LBR36_01710 [Bacteroidales bacterium]|jgi:uncharacterized protein YfaS (alpha-2-macroglobulin family)|nr:hypothetical protein [Bacteroidales bacterium]
MRKFIYLSTIMLIMSGLQAQKNNIEAQKIYSTLNAMSQLQKLDNFYDSTYFLLCREIAQEKVPQNVAIWHSYAASLLQNYMDFNAYKLNNRTALAEMPADTVPISQWDKQNLQKRFLSHIQQSLEAENILQNIDIEQYMILLDTSSLRAVPYCLTLYDFLAQQAISLLQKVNEYNKSATPFYVDKEVYLFDNQTFINYLISTPDSLSYDFYALKIYQQWTKFRIKERNNEALISLTINRLKYAKSVSTLKNKDTLYLRTLWQAEQQFRQQKGYPMITFELGETYYQRGGLYDAQTATQYYDDYKIAVQWFEKTIQIAPNSISANNSKSRLSEIQNPTLGVQMANQSCPSQPDLALLEYKNTDQIYVRLVKVKKGEIASLRAYNSKYTSVERNQKILSYPLIFKEIYSVEDKKDYRQHSIETILPALEAGEYALIVHRKDIESDLKDDSWFYVDFSVSNLTLIGRQNKDKYEFLCLNRTTGQAVKGAKVKVDINKGKKNSPSFELQSDSEGKCSFRINKFADKHYNYFDAVANVKDDYSLEHDDYFTFFDDEDNDEKDFETVQFFTDRAIYRPGQTVYFKGIATKTNTKSGTKLLKNEKITFIFRDNNYQIIDSLTLTSNEYGSVSGSFSIPLGKNTGKYRLEHKVGGNSRGDAHVILVEEYKRPTFEIVTDTLSGSYKLEQNIHITGKVEAYAGYAVDGATVKYRITRSAYFPYSPWWRNVNIYRYPVAEISTGEIKTDENGAFSFDFMAVSDPENIHLEPVYVYNITIDATDISGEMQSKDFSVNVGTKSLILNLILPEKIDKQNTETSFLLTANNLAGKMISTKVDYKIEKLITPDNFLHERLLPIPTDNTLTESEFRKNFPTLEFRDETEKQNWKIAAQIQTGELQTSDTSTLKLPNIHHWQEGYYKFTAIAKDADNQEIKTEKIVLLYSSKSKKCVAYEPITLTADKQTAKTGDTIHLLLGTYLKNANILFEIESDTQILQTKFIHLNQEQQSIEFVVNQSIPYEITFYASLIQDGRYYAKDIQINIDNAQNIDFEFITFRDKLTPGEKETFTIGIRGEKGEKIAAELLCSMYDASLDVFAVNKFNFYIPEIDYQKGTYPFTPTLRLFYIDIYKQVYIDIYKQANRTYSLFSEESYFYYNTPLWKIILSSYATKRVYLAGSVQNKMVQYAPLEHDEVESVAESEVDAGDFSFDMRRDISFANITEDGTTLNSGQGEAKNSDNQQTIIPLRTNFSETAFFYPQLHTDAKGEVSFTFTVPDALTRWKMQGFAHTQNLRLGWFEKILQTQKKLMVVPNLPRFFREGDTMIFAVKVVRLDKNIPFSGNISLLFYDALSGKELDIIQPSLSSQTLDNQSETILMEYPIVIPVGVSAIGYKVIARSEAVEGIVYTDGEEQILPVLSNRILVTETLPVYANAQQKKTFTFEKMKKMLASDKQSQTLVNQSFTFEYTANPLWYVIQSLPYLANYPYECNEQIFSRLYANAIASKIANSSPAIEKVFNLWLNESSDAFCSALEKNQELKSIVLEETPWLMDANSESVDKQRIAKLFNKQQLTSELKNAADKLSDRQLSAGGWSWFDKGEKASFYITTYIVGGCGRLKSMNVAHPLKKSDINKAIAFIDNEMQNQYTQIMATQKTEHAKYCPSINMFYYLYARSFFLKENPIDKNKQTAYNYFLNQAIAAKDLTIYQKALLSCILFYNNLKNNAKAILTDVKNQSQYSQEMGMWWKKEGYGWRWYDAPIERQAQLIEAFHLLGDSLAVENMQRWLLKEKQTTHWSTTTATVSACYALLLRGNGLANLTQTPQANIHIGKHTLRLSEQKTQAGTGYFKTVYPADSITADMATITIENQSSAISWGAAYWQYFENQDKITSAATPLSLEKQLFVVKTNQYGEVLQAITPESPLHKGDKVRVRVVLKTDRDMDYIHLKDMRAAAFEPTETLSGYRSQGGLWYYQSMRDAAANFFIEHLPTGTYVFEYTLKVTQNGSFSNGITTAQCMYAPEYAAHSKGERVKVN